MGQSNKQIPQTILLLLAMLLLDLPHTVHAQETGNALSELKDAKFPKQTYALLPKLLEVNYGVIGAQDYHLRGPDGQKIDYHQSAMTFWSLGGKTPLFHRFKTYRIFLNIHYVEGEGNISRLQYNHEPEHIDGLNKLSNALLGLDFFHKLQWHNHDVVVRGGLSFSGPAFFQNDLYSASVMAFYSLKSETDKHISVGVMAISSTASPFLMIPFFLYNTQWSPSMQLNLLLPGSAEVKYFRRTNCYFSGGMKLNDDWPTLMHLGNNALLPRDVELRQFGAMAYTQMECQLKGMLWLGIETGYRHSFSMRMIPSGKSRNDYLFKGNGIHGPYIQFSLFMRPVLHFKR